MTVSEVSDLTGLSVRTLHYYDKIGLLKPDSIGDNSYRYYGQESLSRLQEIMFLRELDFPLKEIAEILNHPDYDKTQALSRQKELLLLKKTRLEELINVIDSAMEGVDSMTDFSAFENTAYEAERKKYADEARERWGNTDAFRESETKMSSVNKQKRAEIDYRMDEIIRKFSELLMGGAKPSDDSAQKTVSEWKSFITENYYNCTDEILSGLGEMYIGDGRFTENIDRFGKGTAKFMSDSISIYCKK